MTVLAAIARTVIRFRVAPRFAIDDVLLLFACACLIAATGLHFKLVPLAYLYVELEFGNKISLPFPISKLSKDTIFTLRMLHAYTFLSWVVIFAVKFSFLFFFRALIDRVRRLMFYWKIVVLITTVFGGISICDTLLACPHIDAESSESL